MIITLLAIIPFALATPSFGFRGEKQTFGAKGAYAVYFEGDVDRAEVKAVADLLIEREYFSDDVSGEVQLVKRAGVYTLSLPYGREVWEKSDLLATLRQVRDELEKNILHGKVTLVLVDEDFRKTYRKELL